MNSVAQSEIRTVVPLVELYVSGRLDMACLSEFRAVLDEAIQLRPNLLVIDLADCCGIDAAAIDLLLDVHRDLLRADSSLTLRAPTPQLRRTLAIARVVHVLRVIPEVAPPEHQDAVRTSTAGPAAPAVPGVAAGPHNHWWSHEGSVA